MSSNALKLDDRKEKKDGDPGQKALDFERNQVNDLYNLNKKIDLGLSNHVLYQAEDLIPDPPEEEDVFYFLVFRTGDPQETKNLSWKISGFCMDTSAFKMYFSGDLLTLHDCEECRSMCWVPINVRANLNKSVKSVREEVPPRLLPSSGAIIAAKYLQGEIPNIIVPGYKVRNPKCNGHGEIWNRVITVAFQKKKAKLFVGKRNVNFSDPDYAVPVIDDSHDVIEIHCF